MSEYDSFSAPVSPVNTKRACRFLGFAPTAETLINLLDFHNPIERNEYVFDNIMSFSTYLAREMAGIVS